MLKTTIMVTSFLCLNAGNLCAKEWISGTVPRASIRPKLADQQKYVDPTKTTGTTKNPVTVKKSQEITNELSHLDEKIRTFLRVYKKSRQSRVPIVQLPSELKPLCLETAKKIQFIFLRKGSVLLNCLIEFKQKMIPLFTARKIGTIKTCLLKIDPKRLTEQTHLTCLQEMMNTLSTNVDLRKAWNSGHESTVQNLNSKYR